MVVKALAVGAFTLLELLYTFVQVTDQVPLTVLPVTVVDVIGNKLGLYEIVTVKEEIETT